jgi:hypothetical protein
VPAEKLYNSHVLRGAVIVVCVAPACSLVDLSDLRADAGADASSDAGGGADVDAASPLRTHCHAIASCVAPETYCCATCTDDDAGNCYFTSFACVDATAFCNNNHEIPIGCSDQGSCSSPDVCCGTFGSGFSYFEGSSCMTLAACNASPPSRIMCDPNASAPCPSGKQCLAEGKADYDELFSCQ